MASLADRAQPLPAIRLGLSPSSVLLWLVTGVIIVLIGLPIYMVLQGSLLVSAPGEAARYGLQNWQQAWADPQVGPALRNSAGITLLRMVLSFLIAIPVAWLLARTNIPGASWLEFGFWVSFFLPNLAYIQGW